MMVLDKNDPNYRQCSMSVMDNIADPDITFDENGICNYYYEYLAEASKPDYQEPLKSNILTSLISEIKSKKGKYNCIIGVSGGVDSTYLALFAKENGLSPLLVHFDYGWNSELAVKNIESIVAKTGFDLYTYVMDWEEFSSLQRSYFRASVLDLDVPADHMIFGALYKTAKKFRISTILSGNNYRTENTLPKSWNYNKFDLINLNDIHNSFENTKLNHLPKLGIWQRAYYQLVLGVKNVNILNFLDYNKSDVKKRIINELDWKDYGGKHHESIFTRFYQGYILPNKFNIDKRKAHLSDLIFSGQLSREDALNELKEPHYSIDLMRSDFIFVAKKLRFSEEEFKVVLEQTNRKHEYFKTDQLSRDKYFKIMRLLKPITRIIKRFKK
jgi:N-acetyl sugar amidotransferase